MSVTRRMDMYISGTTYPPVRIYENCLVACYSLDQSPFFCRRFTFVMSNLSRLPHHFPYMWQPPYSSPVQAKLYKRAC
eukprot:535859-Pelagomonas_calceolata.AAC.1